MANDERIGVVRRLNGAVELVIDGGTLVLLKLALVPEVSWKGLRAVRTLPSPSAPPPSAERDDGGATPWSSDDPRAAEFLFDLQESASSHTDDKVKLLLTLTTALLAASLAAVSTHGWGGRWVVAVGMLGAVLFLCSSYFGVRIYESPNPPPIGKSERDGAWASELLRAMRINETTHDVRVEIYRGAQRWLFATLLASTMMASVHRPPTVQGRPGSVPSETLSTEYDEGIRLMLGRDGLPVAGWDSARVALIGGLTLLPHGVWLSQTAGGSYEIRGDSIALRTSSISQTTAGSAGLPLDGTYRICQDSTRAVLKGPREIILFHRHSPSDRWPW